MPRKNATTEELRQYILDSSEPVTESGCWLWKNAVCSKRGGYGILRVENKTCRAHRVAYELFVGAIPSGFLVCHSCDTPPCVNPAHLFVGKHAENNGDRKAKGRSKGSPGESHPFAIFSAKDVQAIRSEYAAGGVTQRALAKRYRAEKSAIYSILSRRTWKHIV